MTKKESGHPYPVVPVFVLLSFPREESPDIRGSCMPALPELTRDFGQFHVWKLGDDLAALRVGEEDERRPDPTRNTKTEPFEQF